MPVRRFIINPPKNMTEKSVTEAAQTMFAALKGKDAGAPLEKPLGPSQPVQDTAESVDAVKQDDGEAHVDSGDKDGDTEQT